MKKEWQTPRITNEYDYDQRFTPILDRISKYISFDLIVEFFTSSPSATGGRRLFPYFRTDAVPTPNFTKPLLVTF